MSRALHFTFFFLYPDHRLTLTRVSKEHTGTEGGQLLSLYRVVYTASNFHRASQVSTLLSSFYEFYFQYRSQLTCFVVEIQVQDSPMIRDCCIAWWHTRLLKRLPILGTWKQDGNFTSIFSNMSTENSLLKLFTVSTYLISKSRRNRPQISNESWLRHNSFRRTKEKHGGLLAISTLLEVVKDVCKLSAHIGNAKRAFSIKRF